MARLEDSVAAATDTDIAEAVAVMVASDFPPYGTNLTDFAVLRQMSGTPPPEDYSGTLSIDIVVVSESALGMD